MSLLSKSMRNRLPAMSFGLMAAFGAMGAATLALAPAAEAQKINEKMGPILTEAKTAIDGKNWSVASQKLDAAAPLAKTSQEKILLEQMRLAVAQGKGDKPGMIKSIEALIDMNAPGAAGYKKALPGLYEATGNKAKALQLLKAQVDVGGGTAADNYQIGAASYQAKNYADALKYGNKAIAMSGAKPPEKYLQLPLSVYKDTNKDAEFISGMEKMAMLYPKEEYWNQLFPRIQKDPAYKSDYKLDLYRLKTAAKFKLTTKDKSEWGTTAIYKNLNCEAITAMSPAPADADAGFKNTLTQTQPKAAADKAGLAKEEADAIAGGRGPDLARVAEKAMACGDQAKAIDLFQKAIAKGLPDTVASDYAKLHLGVAQFLAGKKDDARTTWAGIKTDSSAVQFAKHWTMVSKT